MLVNIHPIFLHLQIYDRLCLQGKSECTVRYCGSQDGLCVYSSKTVFGDEIGYIYLNLIENSQSSISCFHHLMDSKYKGHACKIDFLCSTTTTLALFSWMSNFQYDFRTQCSECGSNPKVLAGDGTKTGILMKNAHFTGEETAEVEEGGQEETKEEETA